MFEYKSIELRNRNSIQLPSDQKRKQSLIDPNKIEQNIPLICYRIHLIHEKQEIFVYLFKNIDPNSTWYEKKIREGDRLIALNDQDTISMSSEKVYSIMTENQSSFTCQVIWHPELYFELIGE